MQGALGDLQCEQSDGTLLRGPMWRLSRSHSRIELHPLWIARRERGQDWKRTDNFGLRILGEPYLSTDVDGIFSFWIPDTGLTQIFPVSSLKSSLDPSQVQNLTNDETRKSFAKQFRLSMHCTWEEILRAAEDRLGADSDELLELIRHEAAQFA